MIRLTLQSLRCCEPIPIGIRRLHTINNDNKTIQELLEEMKSSFREQKKDGTRAMRAISEVKSDNNQKGVNKSRSNSGEIEDSAVSDSSTSSTGSTNSTGSTSSTSSASGSGSAGESRGRRVRKEKPEKSISRAKRCSYSVNPSKLNYEPLELPSKPTVPTLAHNLDRVLFDPGVHFLKDPRTNVYNFTPFLEKIMSIKDFDFDYIPKYVPSGKDSKLHKLARDHHLQYVASSSSLTSILTKFHLALSNDRPPQILELSKNFPGKTTTFTATQLRPVSVFVRYNDKTGTYSIDADATDSQELILTILGNCLETMLTTPEKIFRNYHKSLSHNLDPQLKNQPQESHHYTQIQNFLVRSQLDCFDSRLPGSGIFDLKTRAVCAVRHDLDYAQVNDGSDYSIKTLDGEYHSFSREWFELIRSTMFKYSLQARIGRMDGIFIAYHNIRQMFGFQYVPQIEMDRIFHWTSGNVQKPSFPKIENECVTNMANSEFKMSMELLEKAVDKIIKDHKKVIDGPTSFNVVFSCKYPGVMSVMYKPMIEEHVNKIQSNSLLEEQDKVVSKDEEYSLYNDQHTIWKHADSNIQYVPPDIRAFDIDIYNQINGSVISRSEYPSLKKPTDIWTIRYDMQDLTKPALAKLYRSTFKDTPLIQRPLTSTPVTERTDEVTELLNRARAMEELLPPTLLQRKLRKLEKRDQQRIKRQEEEQTPKDKLVWFPKPLDWKDKR